MEIKPAHSITWLYLIQGYNQLVFGVRKWSYYIVAGGKKDLKWETLEFQIQCINCTREDFKVQQIYISLEFSQASFLQVILGLLGFNV